MKDRKQMDSFGVFVVVVCCITLVMVLVMPGNSIIQAFHAKSETRKDRALIKELQEKTLSTQSQIDQLKSNPDTLEKFAREQFLFAAPGDDVYIVGD